MNSLLPPIQLLKKEKGMNYGIWNLFVLDNWKKKEED
jgi:hypothetical protein